MKENLLSTKFNKLIIPVIILCSSCDFYKDSFTPRESAAIVIYKDGLIRADLMEKNDSIFLSLKNISGTQIENLTFVLNVYSNSVKTKEWLRISRHESIQFIEVNESKSQGFLSLSTRNLSSSMVRFEILSMGNNESYSNVSGLVEGTYAIVNDVSGITTSYFIDGYINYKGDFAFEADGPDEYFTFQSGHFGGSSVVAQFLKADNTVVSNSTSTYSISNDQITIDDFVLTNSLKVSLKLNRTN